MRWEQQVKLMIHSSYRPLVNVKKEKKIIIRNKNTWKKTIVAVI